MNVDRIRATIRYSQDTGKGAWKSIELGAEATIGDPLTWQADQVELYQDLAEQLRQLWGQAPGGNGNGHTIPEPAPTQTPAQEPVGPVGPPGGGLINGHNGAGSHWCHQHQTEYIKFQKEGRVWYSHRVGETGWCREK